MLQCSNAPGVQVPAGPRVPRMPPQVLFQAGMSKPLHAAKLVSGSLRRCALPPKLAVLASAC